MFQSDLFPAGEQLPSMPLAYAIGTRIAALLASGRHLTRTYISGLFAEETGSLDWGSAWTIDDYNNAVEIGALLWLRESSRIDLATSLHEADARFDWLEAALPPRHVRSEAQVELQQFSTPPMLAWLMAKAAAISAQDTLLEPSAGNGSIALWGSVQNASLLLNEIDPARRDGLGHIFPSAAITAHDGELIADLPRSPAPSVVLMNPPFARSLERGKDGETAQRHLRSAIRSAAAGARIVAIVPERFDASNFAKERDEASLLLDVRLEQMFRRTGTGIAVRVVVIDKTPTASSPAINGDTCDLIALHKLLTDARRDWEALGGLPLDLQPLSRWKLGHPVTMSEGILFVTYPTLRSGRAEDTRLDQILAWAGDDFDGVIAFDEAHAMANALGSSSTRGKVKARRPLGTGKAFSMRGGRKPMKSELTLPA